VLTRGPADTVTIADAIARTLRFTRGTADSVTFTDTASLPGQIIELDATAGNPYRRWTAGQAARAWSAGAPH
jgi:hypothetical protein